MTMPATEKTTK